MSLPSLLLMLGYHRGFQLQMINEQRVRNERPEMKEQEAGDKDKQCIHKVHLLKSWRWMNSLKSFPDKSSMAEYYGVFTYGNRIEGIHWLGKMEPLRRVKCHHTSLPSSRALDKCLLLEAKVKLNN